MIEPALWQGRRVLLTGHTGFKGAWLSLWLQRLGAQVTGVALEPPTQPNLFETARVAIGMRSMQIDVRDNARLHDVVSEARPEVVIHMAAQSLVRRSYAEPADTYSTNIMGTVNVLEAVRRTGSARVFINVTSDKCYENRQWVWGYREDEPMGGSDPYSSSKGCSELVTAAYRRSFFSGNGARTAVATARAGNVIGGGDWAEDRLVPDFFRALKDGNELLIRNPDAVRPWQYVLEPLAGYLMLAQALWQEPGNFAEAWNFGPSAEDEWPVRRVVQQLASHWGPGLRWTTDAAHHPAEARYLKLDCAKARARLGWQPRVALDEALGLITGWFRAYFARADIREATLREIDSYQSRKVITAS